MLLFSRHNPLVFFIFRVQHVLRLCTCLSAVFVGQATAGPMNTQPDTCNPHGESNPELITCAVASLSRADRVLNEQYALLKVELTDTAQHAQLIEAQRAWIKFRDAQCQAVYDAEYPGAEAPIARLSCLGGLTSARVGELVYLRTGILNDGFGKAVWRLVLTKTASSRAEAISMLGGDSRHDPIWNSYAIKSCALSKFLYEEDETDCMNRQRFFDAP